MRCPRGSSKHLHGCCFLHTFLAYSYAAASATAAGTSGESPGSEGDRPSWSWRRSWSAAEDALASLLPGSSTLGSASASASASAAAAAAGDEGAEAAGLAAAPDEDLGFEEAAGAATDSSSQVAQCSGLPEGLQAGTTYRWPFLTKDGTGQYLRHFTFHIPVNYTGTARKPSLFYFHGWGEGFPCENCSFHRVADANDFITVMPEGMDDGQEGMLSWNVLSGGRDDVCTEDAHVTEYTSCTTLGELGRCNTYTCHDDVKFVADLTEYLHTFLCLDEDRMYATGASNGAMFLYSLIPSLQDRGLKPHFQAILPAYGAVFEHMEDVQHIVPGTAIFAHHGTHDDEIPPSGGESQDHFLYVSIHDTLRKQAIANGCSPELEQVWTPWDGQQQLTACYAYKDCEIAPVWRCDYDYGHGFWTDFQVEIMWWQLYWMMPDAKDRVIV